MKNLLQLFLLVLLWPCVAVAQDNAVYQELVNQGVALTNGKTVRLPEPTMADGLKADAQQAAMNKVGPKNKQLLQSYLRGNANDAFASAYMDEKGSNPDDSIGRRVDLYFVAKGKLKTIASKGFVKDQIAAGKENTAEGDSKKSVDDSAKSSKDAEKQEDGDVSDGKKEAAKKNKSGRPENGKIEFYTDDELKQRKLSTVDKDNLKERYAHGLINLMDEVQVTGTGYGFETITDESVMVAFKLDPRFAKDAKYPNQYQKITTDADGKLVFGKPVPYAGYGGYAKLTKLQGAEDKVFVEYHIVFEEPHDWFNGTTQLISKLDEYSYQPDVRRFRRNLLDYEKKHPAAGNQPAKTGK